VARATAAVFVDGRRAGSAVLVSPRYLVTAAHVLQQQDPGTMARKVEVEFPGQGAGEQPGRMSVARVDLGPAGPRADVAVLDLGEDRPGQLPAPVPVWPAARLPGRVQVFGYPLAEALLNGVWRQFAVAGPEAGQPPAISRRRHRAASRATIARGGRVDPARRSPHPGTQTGGSAYPEEHDGQGQPPQAAATKQ
jgi:hypothetical protein